MRCFADQRSRRARFWDGLSIPSKPAQARAYLPKTIAYARGCGALSGALLEHVSTTDDARDLDYLRQLVGDRQLTYWAVSYGTFLGETYANMFPRRVRAMVLDGVVDPRVVVSGAAARFANTVVAMDQWVEGVRVAVSARRTAAVRWRAGVRSLRGWPDCWRGCDAGRSRRPRRHGRRAQLRRPLGRPVRLAGQSRRLAAAGADLRQAANGDGSALATQARAVLAGTRSAAADSQTAIMCADSPARQGPDAWPQVIARLTRVSAWAGLFVGWSNWAPCASWPARSAERYTGPWNRPTKIPLLVIGTTADPGTPYVNARRVARLLGNAVLLTHDGYGHTSEADPSRCVDHATSAYLVFLAIPRKGTVCRSDRQPFGPETVLHGLRVSTREDLGLVKDSANPAAYFSRRQRTPTPDTGAPSKMTNWLTYFCTRLKTNRAPGRTFVSTHPHKPNPCHLPFRTPQPRDGRVVP